jgi:hypothetical protein
MVEGGMNRAFKLLGLNPAHGTLMAVIRRIRVIFWIFIGLLIILFKKSYKHGKNIAVQKSKENES